MNKIICGDCAKVLAGFPADYIDLTVTSPPYDNLRDYNGYVFDFEPIAQELWRVTKPGGVVVWVVADATIDGSETGTSFRQALGFMEIGFNLNDTMIYQKYGSGLPHNDRRYGNSFEYMFVFSKDIINTANLIRFPSTNKIKPTTRRLANGSIKKGKYNVGGGVIANIWQFPGEIKQNHPGPFPEALARDHIISWSNPGDIVLDPMCGSGTTLKMAKELGRNYIGIDISQEYCDLSQRRVEGAKVPLFVMPPEPNGKQETEQLELIA